MNIIDVAKLAGVSVSAVSRYLNNGYLSEEKRERIARVIKDTGYRPKRSESMLRNNPTQIIGVIIPKMDMEPDSNMVEGISETLEGLKYKTIIAVTNNDPEKELEYLTVFKNLGVDGVIISPRSSSKPIAEAVTTYKKPIVVLMQNIPKASCVLFDNYKGAYLATECLIRKGAKRIAYIGYLKSDQAAGRDRFDGFADAMKENGLRVEPKLMCESEYTYTDARIAVNEFLDRRVKYDAIFCGTDVIGIILMDELRKRGIAVPDEVMVASEGDLSLSRHLTPSLTSAHLFYKTAGREAANMIVDLMESDEIMPVRKKLVEVRLMERQSTNKEIKEED
jgi:LacI family sucrose operon transcriptional repressor